MAKVRDILKKRAKISEKLSESLVEDSNDDTQFLYEHEVDEKGNKVLVFQDPLYSRERRSVINYAVFRGKWEFEELEDIDETQPEKCAIKFYPRSDFSNFSLAFHSLKDRVEFISSVYSDNEMKQIGSGLHLEDLANSNLVKNTGKIIGASVAAYGLFKIISAFTNKNKD